MKKGEIFYGRKHSEAYHPIIYLGNYDEDFFIGAMLTSSNNFTENILMKPEHFKVNDEKGNRFYLGFYNTHLVKAKLLKRNEWSPFRKIGELTETGISFVDENVCSETEKLWEDFLKN